MIAAVRSFLPFLDENPYENVRTHVLKKLERKQGIGKGVTAQELTADLPYGINTVTARIKELRDQGKVYVYNKRECKVQSHNRDVNAYKLTSLGWSF